MKLLSLLAAVLALGLTLTTAEAEAAKRLGSGASSGMQRQMNVPQKSPGVSPAQAPNAANSPSAANSTASAQAKRSWMRPLAGLAAGLGLAALASHFGFGEELASMMTIALLVMGLVMLTGFIMRRRTAAQLPAMAGAGGGSIPRSAFAPRDAIDAVGSSGVAMPPPADAALSSHSYPADFDVAGFVRQAKVNFIRLQTANDAGKLDDLRGFTTPEMFAELQTTILERGATSQHTDVLEIDAEVLEVVEEAKRYVLTARFTGLIREDERGPAEPIDELWHLVKPRHGNGGWLLAGIQQTQ